MIFTEEDVNCNFVCASTNACVNNTQDNRESVFRAGLRSCLLHAKKCYPHFIFF